MSDWSCNFVGAGINQGIKYSESNMLEELKLKLYHITVNKGLFLELQCVA